ncbi:MAG: aminodeoxychorismate/anthranilate synthase component II [Bacteroidota bacterium]|nr:aminodeoxychorismate/anthranilate synthase component II [Bacteroidota bacterium]
MKIALIDNFDSFTYNLVHILEKYTNHLDVFRSNDINMEHLNGYDKIILSPGPGLPSETQIMKLFKKQLPDADIFGVCLGLQLIYEIFGGKLKHMKTVNHGLQKDTIISDSDENIYRKVPNPFLSGRYHSWVADPEYLPKELKITAIDQNNNIMSIAHKKANIKAVQFHPESILTPYGEQIIKNWVKN